MALGPACACRTEPLQLAFVVRMKKRVLVVDDDRVVLLVLRDALRRLDEDCEVITARDACEALDALRLHAFDVMVTDLTLPGITGVALTEAARRLSDGMPILWITAYGCHNVCREGAELGVVCCLDKPVEIRQIREAVRAALSPSSVPTSTPPGA